MSIGGYTKTGPRDANEDSLYFLDFSDVDSFVNGICAFAMVSDGMGGYQGGDVASGLAVACAQRYLSQLLHMADDNMVELDTAAALIEIIQNAHESILAESSIRGNLSMGATFVGAFVSRTHAWIAHVGDSRAYLVHDGQCRQLTEDHSLVGRMLSRGVITEKEAQNHPDRNRIERALGFDNARPDMTEVDLAPGDALLLCSDGVYTVLDADTLGSCVKGAREASAAAERIVRLAIRRGTDDNSTAVVVVLEQGDEAKKDAARNAAQGVARDPAQEAMQDTAQDTMQGAAQGAVQDTVQVTAVQTQAIASDRRIKTIGAQDGMRTRSRQTHRRPKPKERPSRTGSSGSRSASGSDSWARVLPFVLAGLLTGCMVYFGMRGCANKRQTEQEVSAVGTDAPAQTTTDDGTGVPGATQVNAEGDAGKPVGGPTADGTADQPEQSPQQPQQTPVATPGEGYAEYTIPLGGGMTLKYIDKDGVAQLFTYDQLSLTDEPLILPGKTVVARTTSDSYGRYEKVYQTLSDDYLDDLKRDISRYAEGSTEFDSALSQLIDPVTYRIFVQELYQVGSETVEETIGHLAIESLITSGE